MSKRHTKEKIIDKADQLEERLLRISEFKMLWRCIRIMNRTTGFAYFRLIKGTV